MLLSEDIKQLEEEHEEKPADAETDEATRVDGKRGN